MAENNDKAKEQLEKQFDEAEVPDITAAEQQETANEGEVCFELSDMNNYMEALEAKNKLIEETTARYQRLQADFDNFRRRTRQEKEDAAKFITEGIVADFLPVVDNFARALSTAKQEDSNFATGIEMIFRQMSGVLEGLGVEKIKAVGLVFDPLRHEAVMRVEDAEQPDGMIIEELQTGYSLKGKVIRASMVKVVGNN